VSAYGQRLRAVLQRGFLPFREARPLPPSERRIVAAIWGLAGGLFACAWVGGFLLLLPPLAGGRGALIAIGLVIGAAIGFALAGYAMVGIGNRLVRRPHTPPSPSRKSA
jgi:hypothetical protein